MKYVGALLGLLAVGICVNAQKVAKPEKSAALFTVKDQVISPEEFEYIYRKNNQGKKDEFTDEKIRQYLDLFVRFKLKVHEAEQRGMDTTQAFRKEFRTYRDELKKPFVAASDDLNRLVKETYENMKQEVKAAHILVNVSPDAPPSDTLKAYEKIVSIRKRALAGESFENLAREFSEDPSAKQNGGNLGYFTALQMVYPFEVAAYQTKPGDISAPVRTRFGYHLIKVTDKRAASGEVEVAHILFRGNDEKSKNKAFEAYDQWKAGRPWNDLCKEFSDDTGTRDTGGKLRPFGVGALSSVPEFEATAFALQQPGDVSDPFSSALGWHLVRLERKIPLPAFEELEPSLKRRVGRDERLQISKSIQLGKRKRAVGFEEVAATVTQLMSLADTSLQKGHWSAVRAQSNASEVLFRIGSLPTTVREFYKFVSENQRPSALPPPSYLQQLLDQFAEDRINEQEDQLLQKSNADYRNLLNEYREGILLFSIMEKEVWAKGSEDTTGQRSYYERNKSKYVAGERLRARVMGAPDKSVIESLQQKITKGDTLREKDMAALKVSMSPRAFEKGENKAIDKITWAMGLHETEVDGTYYLIEVERLLPAGTKTLDEARSAVISDYQTELEDQWIEQLRQRYPVKINKKVLKKVIANLKAA